MRLSEFRREMDDLLITFIRSGEIKDGVRLFDPLPLATAWLRGEEEEWAWRNRGFVDADEMPEALLAQGDLPFSDGHCSMERRRAMAVIHMQPAFMSPGSERLMNGSAVAMPGFGALGGHRFTALHEIGHYLGEQMGLYRPMPDHSPGARLRGEALADGFAVAWAVAKGADPAACVRDVGTFRACASVHSFAAAYQIYAILAPAAEIGRQHQGRATSDPRSIIDAVHRAGAPCLPAHGLIDELHGLEWDQVRTRPQAGPLVKAVEGFLEQQLPWSRKNELNWWSRLIVANPAEAPALRRLPGATYLAVAASEFRRRETERPFHAAALLKMLHGAALAGGAERAEALKAVVPKTSTRQAHAEALRAAAALFDDPLDMRIREALGRLAEHTLICRKDPETAPSRTVKGADAPVRPLVLVDARAGAFTYDSVEALASRLSGTPVRHIAVIADTTEKAAFFARSIRIESDNMRAATHVMTPEKLTVKRSDILAKARQGRMMLIGEFPELAREPVHTR